ncbi:hypothetical protein [Gemmatimonas sp.]|uniref:hypothetical protein n=1 Tax=Gemmatimonas sp. TaxID=1962908 RepID=UPI0033425BAF
MNDARVVALLNGAGLVIDCILSRGDVANGVDITDVEPRPGIGWRYLAGVFTPPPAFTRDAVQVKADAIARVNMLAGACRAKYLTVVPGQAETYLLKADELRAYDAAVVAGNVVPSDFPILATEAAATGASLADTVELVRTTRAQWLQLAAVVEGMRRGAIVAIEAATTEAAVLAAIPETWP